MTKNISGSINKGVINFLNFKESAKKDIPFTSFQIDSTLPPFPDNLVNLERWKQMKDKTGGRKQICVEEKLRKYECYSKI